jgi:hypothetical protein
MAAWRIFLRAILKPSVFIIGAAETREPRLYGEYFCWNVAPATKFACEGFSPIRRLDGWLISPHPPVPDTISDSALLNFFDGV